MEWHALAATASRLGRLGVRAPATAIRRAVVLLAMYSRVAASLRHRNASFIRARHTGAHPLAGSTRAAVFVHYDPAGRVHDYVLHYLRALSEAGCAVVVVSNAPQLDAAAVQRLLPLSALVLHRRNVGYDFGAYKDGLAALGDLTRFELVVLANDSVYGPLFDLAPLLARCDRRADIWGITDSPARRYHLQSYFLALGPRALASPDLAAFWRSVGPVQSREWVIRNYELGLTQEARRAGLRCAALYEYARLAAAASGTVAKPKRPLNPMLAFWDDLITRGHCPFIKRELLMYNPLRLPHVGNWKEVIRRVSPYDIDLIERHLRDRRSLLHRGVDAPAPNHGALNHGAPNHGAPNHGAPNHGAPNHGASNRAATAIGGR
jgi:lipopolysaccharide biosynthesis protein